MELEDGITSKKIITNYYDLFDNIISCVFDKDDFFL